MPVSEQRAAYISAQIEAIHQNLRFLEAIVREPIGLTTDLLLLRESILSENASEKRDRQAFQDIAGRGLNPQPSGLNATMISIAIIELVKTLSSENNGIVSIEWFDRATMVLERIKVRLGASIRKSIAEKFRGGLYVIIDPEHTLGRPVEEIAQAIVNGGASVIQLRDKKRDKASLIKLARKLQKICSDAGTVFVVNDDPDVALLSGAWGLHIGQKDLSIEDARTLLRPTNIIGRSNSLLEEALESESGSADYVAVGAMYPTSTKDETRPAGLEILSAIKSSVAVPVVAIGGINEGNVDEVIKAGADCICVISAVCEAENPEASTQRLVEIIDQSLA